MELTRSIVGRTVPRGAILKIWPFLRHGLVEYRKRSPHQLPRQADILEDLQSPDGDELFIFSVDKRFAGFVTFKVAHVDGERWGTLGIIWVDPRFRHSDVLDEAISILSTLLRKRGCDIMNFMTKREGFKRLAPRMGFQPRIIEWMKEL